jgi:hypothetical protein
MYLSKALGLGQPVHTQASEELVLRQLLKTGLKINMVIDERNVDFFLSPAMAKDPYFPKRSPEAREYWMLPQDERKKVTAVVDRIFREATGISRKLDPKNPKDLPWIRIWLRLRDQIVVIRTQKSQSTTSAQRSDGITRVNATNASSSPNIHSAPQTKPVLHLTKVKISHLPEIALTRIRAGYYEGVFELPIPRGGAFEVEVRGRVQIEEAGKLINREYDASKDGKDWPLARIKGEALINITNTPGLSSDNPQGVKIRPDGTIVFSNYIGVRGVISILIIHPKVIFSNGKSVAVAVVLRLINLDTFLSLLDTKERALGSPQTYVEKDKYPPQTHLQFLASIRKMFQPAPGSPLASVFDRFLHRNRKITKLAPIYSSTLQPVESDEGRYIRYFQNLTIGNDKVDIGHVLVGIEASRRQKPDSIDPPPTSDARTEAFMTWAGDLGSALEPYAEATASGRQVDIKAYLEEKASSADLLGDIDGINIGSVYDETKSLAENLRQYYGTKPFRRFHDYLARLRDDNNKPILALAQQKPPKIDQTSVSRVTPDIRVFCQSMLAVRKNSGRLNDSQFSKAFDIVQEDSEEMKTVVDYFFTFIERGLAKES